MSNYCVAQGGTELHVIGGMQGASQDVVATKQ
jgi:hypothetical protein